MNRKQIISNTAGVIALFLSVIALSGYIEKACAVTYYVAEPDFGSDSNTGSIDQPFATIQHAVNVANSGDAVSVAAGVYNENLVMKTGVSVIGNGPADTSIVGIASTDGVVLFNNIQDAVLKGFTITISEPVPSTDRGVLFQGTTDNTAVIQNCIITNVQYGIFVWASAIPTIQNNTLVANNDEQGIYIGNTATAPVIRNNIITGYSYAGIHVIAGIGSPTPIIEYNDVFNNGWDVEGTPTGRGDYVNYPSQTDSNGNISADPLFAYPEYGDFHLAYNSPCIDAGNPASQYNDSDGSRNDMGAFGGPCTYLSPMSQQVTAAGGIGFSFNVLTSLPGCFWTANNTVAWITNVSESIPGETGNGIVTYDVSPNTGSVRQGTITIDGQVFTVIQDAGTYTLYVVKSGPGTGAVVSTETPTPLINCGTSCSYALQWYPGGTRVRLVATADLGSLFAGWSDACSGTGACDVTMDAAKLVTAAFTKNSYMVTTRAEQGGSISPPSATVNYGGTVQFTVTPDDGYHTVNVSGCWMPVNQYVGGVIAAKKKKKVKSSAAGEVYITGPITADCTVSASFAINTFTVTPIAGEHGSMKPAIPQTVDYNGTASFDIAAEEGYHIESVSGCGGTAYTAAKKKKKKKLSAVLEMTYTTGHITESCPVTASFAINTFTVTPKAGAHGSIDPSGPKTVNYHDMVSFTVTPDTGYHIASVTGTGCGVHPSEGGTYITEPVTGDCTVEATFAVNAYTATITKTGTGSGTVTVNDITCDEGNTCGGPFEYGTKLVLKIKPDAGYKIKDIEINGKSIGAVMIITLKQILSNYDIVIIFEPV